MGIAVAIFLLLLGVVITWKVIGEHLRGEVELLSVRNFAVLGLLYFQVWAPMYPLITRHTSHYVISDLNRAGLLYAAMLTVFTVVFWITYRRGPLVRSMAARTPAPNVDVPTSVLWVMAIALSILAISMKIGVRIPLIGILSNYSANALAALSVGIAGWIWARRIFNPVAFSLAGGLFLVGSSVALLGAFGRRALISVGIAALWGMYYSSWRHEPMRQWLPKAGLLAVIPLTLLLAYTSVRADFDTSDVSNIASGLQRESDVLQGAATVLVPDAGTITLWIIDTHPRDFEYRHLFTIYNFFILPVPRYLWPDKPEPLARELVGMTNLRNVAKDMNLASGIVGHAAAEGGWYALIIYAILGGLLLRYADEVVRINAWNPLIVLPFGTTLGQIVALPRGEASLFAFIFVVGTTSTYIVMLVFLKILQSMNIGHFVAWADSDELVNPEDSWEHDDSRQADSGYTNGGDHQSTHDGAAEADSY